MLDLSKRMMREAVEDAIKDEQYDLAQERAGDFKELQDLVRAATRTKDTNKRKKHVQRHIEVREEPVKDRKD